MSLLCVDMHLTLATMQTSQAQAQASKAPIADSPGQNASPADDEACPEGKTDQQ